MDKAAFLDPKFKKCVSHYDDTVEKRLWIILVLWRKNQTEKHSCKQKMKGLGAVLNHIADDIPSLVKASCSLSPTESVKRQIKEYCDEPVMPTDTDALEWWLQRQACYPALAYLAKHYL